MMTKNIFPLKTVGDYYNKNFINLAMDMEKGEGPVILNTYKINAFPTLLFVNGEGGEVYRIVSSKKEAELLQVGADALASKTVYPVNSQAQQQIALIGREIPDFCYRDSTGKEVKFLFQFAHIRNLLTTRPAPGGPHIHVHIISPERRKLHFFASRIAITKIRYFASDQSDLLLSLRIDRINGFRSQCISTYLQQFRFLFAAYNPVNFTTFAIDKQKGREGIDFISIQNHRSLSFFHIHRQIDEVFIVIIAHGF
jgi:hypothetical protein